MEIHYHRPQESSRPTHTEVTVIFIPIFTNLIPEYDVVSLHNEFD